jgi:hypothetical protein
MLTMHCSGSNNYNVRNAIDIGHPSKLVQFIVFVILNNAERVDSDIAKTKLSRYIDAIL